MSHYSVKPVDTSLQPSRLLLALLVCMHIVCLIVVSLLPLHFLLRLGMILLLLGSLALQLRQYLLRPRWVELHLAADGVFSLLSSSGQWQQFVVAGSSFVTTWLAVLHLQNGGKCSRFLLLPDMLPAEDFRRLRVWLRWGLKADNSET